MTNKDILRNAFAETAEGNGRPFIDMLADDVEWSIIGSTDWSRTYKGKAAVVQSLLRPLSDQFEGPNVVTAQTFIAEGDTVVVEGRNHSVTKGGDAYPNRYCWVFTLRDGQVVAITEYCDTQLIQDVLRSLTGPGAA